MNKQNFEWNKTAFCEEFKNATNAGEFINVWNRITKADTSRHMAVPIIDYDSQSDIDVSGSASSSQGSSNKHSLSDADNTSQPTPKRVHSNQSNCNQHANPMDDTIHSKKIGNRL